jgi:hypothetical protein
MGTITRGYANLITADGPNAVASGSIQAADLAAGVGGKVLQVVSATYNVYTITTSTSYVTSGLEVSITPSSASNKVLIIANGVGLILSSATHAAFTLFRGATNLSDDDAMNHLYSDTGSHRSQFAMNYLDSPSTTSSITYSVRFKSQSGAAAAVAHQNDSMSSITALEIAG